MIRALFTFLFLMILNGCGTITQDCTSLSGDRDAYRNCIAIQGDQAAQYELGLAAFENREYATAISWFKRAADNKPVGSNTNYAASQPLTDPRTSPRYAPEFTKTEVKMLPGHRGAQRMLVDIYEKGLGVTADPEQAQKYRDMINQL
ncbi:hypothetical protein [Pseudemcibacter aquimaris]|uniref:hypothetical protein n=1 Tax=Pseudemcibacter aquimaris TaxID=2857064 RepID=UPI002011F80D|nr:hypothetical protein [Pseudemcibacter aquimaris]MCC3860982.1 hypothetical protein [Pseudemcibacter aquimaris]WDU59800.1 hypothetical protein KW060_05970 [Pseudemcibacter aquimaris]